MVLTMTGASVVIRTQLRQLSTTLAKCLWSQKLCSHQNPLTVAFEELEDPSIVKDDIIFEPSAETVQKAATMFDKCLLRDLAIINCGISPRHLPPVDDIPEIALLGRSNVGKSSLVNAILKANTAVVSKTPGRTKRLKMYQVGKLLKIVDMPGYGHNMPGLFVTTAEVYLKDRQNLCHILLLIDGKGGFTQNDVVAMNMLENIKRPYTVVFTKADKSKHQRLISNWVTLKQYRKDLATSCSVQPLLVSSHLNAGLDFLRTYLLYLSGHVQIEK